LSEAKPRRRLRPGLAGQVLIGLALGIATGLFFGELAASLKVIGQIFIGLLQMTVLPYILVSLVAALGRLSYGEAKTLALRGGMFIVLFWGVTLATVVGIALSFPAWESATFFSSSLAEPERKLDFIQLYIPTNPFFALANTIVPAIVLFSLAMGLALIGAPGKATLLPNLQVIEDALMRIAGTVARTAPIGVFALVADAAGTMQVEALGRAQVYLLLYLGAALLLSLWVLPGLISVLTPLPFRRVVGHTQDALITAFATGSLLIVIPLMAERSKELLEEMGLRNPDAESAVDLMVPVNFNLPNMGKLLSLSFVLFAGWFSGNAVPVEQYPLFLVSGLVSFFGEVVVALPFLLDLMRIPSDFFQLFLPVDTVTGRFGTLLAAVHTIVQALLTAAAVSGAIRLRWVPLARYTIVSLALALAVFVGLRLFFEHVVPQKYRAYDQLVQMDLAIDRGEIKVLKPEEAEPLSEEGAGKRFAAIKKRGTLRVGYGSDRLPYVFHNADGKLVGYDVDLVHLLASELGVGLDFINIKPKDARRFLDEGRVDIVVGGIPVTPERTLQMRFTEPYMHATLGFVVRDHERKRFATIGQLKSAGALRIATFDVPYYNNLVRAALPKVELILIRSPADFFKAPEGQFDAMLASAEAGSAWTLIFPQFSVVVPKPNIVRGPLAIGTPKNAPELHEYVSTWVALKKENGTTRILYDHWILGQGAKSTRPRWSIIRDVLGWID